eukprot:252460-Amphidinium_carterae.2
MEHKHLETEDEKKNVRICWSSGRLYWHKEVIGVYTRNSNKFDYATTYEACALKLQEYIRKYYG